MGPRGQNQIMLWCPHDGICILITRREEQSAHSLPCEEVARCPSANQEEGPHQKSPRWSQDAWPPELWEINACRLSHLTHSILLWQPKLRQMWQLPRRWRVYLWGSVHLFGCIDKNDLTLDDTLKMLSLGFGKKDACCCWKAIGWTIEIFIFFFFPLPTILTPLYVWGISYYISLSYQ